MKALSSLKMPVNSLVRTVCDAQFKACSFTQASNEKNCMSQVCLSLANLFQIRIGMTKVF